MQQKDRGQAQAKILLPYLLMLMLEIGRIYGRESESFGIVPKDFRVWDERMTEDIAIHAQKRVPHVVLLNFLHVQRGRRRGWNIV